MASIPASNNIGAQPVRLALVGLGRWGQILARALDAHPDVTLVHATSSNLDAARFVNGSCTIDRDWRDTLTDRSLDGIVIATPPTTHAAIAAAALDAGLALFIEKPLTLDLNEAEALLAHAEHKNAVAFVDHVHLFHPAYRHLKTLVRDAGKITSLRLVNGNDGPVRDDTDVLWDWGAHEMALALDLVGQEPDAIAVTANDAAGHDLDLSLAFPGNVAAKAHIGVAFDRRCRLLAVSTPNGAWAYDEQAPDALVALADGVAIADVVPGQSPDGATPVALDDTSPLENAISDFAAAIRSNVGHLDGLRLGVRVVRLLSQC